jgi:hypothetical protein
VFLPHSPSGMADVSRQIAEAIMVGNQVPGPGGAAHEPHPSASAGPGSVPITTPARAA